MSFVPIVEEEVPSSTEPSQIGPYVVKTILPRSVPHIFRAIATSTKKTKASQRQRKKKGSNEGRRNYHIMVLLNKYSDLQLDFRLDFAFLSSISPPCMSVVAGKRAHMSLEDTGDHLMYTQDVDKLVYLPDVIRNAIALECPVSIVGIVRFAIMLCRSLYMLHKHHLVAHQLSIGDIFVSSSFLEERDTSLSSLRVLSQMKRTSWPIRLTKVKSSKVSPDSYYVEQRSILKYRNCYLYHEALEREMQGSFNHNNSNDCDANEDTSSDDSHVDTCYTCRMLQMGSISYIDFLLSFKHGIDDNTDETQVLSRRMENVEISKANDRRNSTGEEKNTGFDSVWDNGSCEKLDFILGKSCAGIPRDPLWMTSYHDDVKAVGHIIAAMLKYDSTDPLPEVTNQEERIENDKHNIARLSLSSLEASIECVDDIWNLRKGIPEALVKFLEDVLLNDSDSGKLMCMKECGVRLEHILSSMNTKRNSSASKEFGWTGGEGNRTKKGSLRRRSRKTKDNSTGDKAGDSDSDNQSLHSQSGISDHGACNPGVFVFPRKVFGRRKQQVRIFNLIQDSRRTETARVLFVSGRRGVGKTSVINGAVERAVESSQPSSPLISLHGSVSSGAAGMSFPAIQPIVSKLVSIARFVWSKERRDAFIGNFLDGYPDHTSLKVLCHTFPSLSLLFPPDSLCEDGPTASTSVSFISLICSFFYHISKEVDLVMTITDIQNALPADIRLINAIMQACVTTPTTFIISHSDASTPSRTVRKPKSTVVEQLEEFISLLHTSIEWIRIEPWGFEDAQSFLSHCPTAYDVTPVLDYCKEEDDRSSLCPFAIFSVLCCARYNQSTNDRGILETLDELQESERKMMKTIDSTLNDQLRRAEKVLLGVFGLLNDEVRSVLHQAALIGSHFTLETLSIACNKPVSTVVPLIEIAIWMGLLRYSSSVTAASLLSSEPVYGSVFDPQSGRGQSAAHKIMYTFHHSWATDVILATLSLEKQQELKEKISHNLLLKGISTKMPLSVIVQTLRIVLKLASKDEASCMQDNHRVIQCLSIPDGLDKDHLAHYLAIAGLLCTYESSLEEAKAFTLHAMHISGCLSEPSLNGVYDSSTDSVTCIKDLEWKGSFHTLNIIVDTLLACLETRSHRNVDADFISRVLEIYLSLVESSQMSPVLKAAIRNKYLAQFVSALFPLEIAHVQSEWEFQQAQKWSAYMWTAFGGVQNRYNVKCALFSAIPEDECNKLIQDAKSHIREVSHDRVEEISRWGEENDDWLRTMYRVYSTIGAYFVQSRNATFARYGKFILARAVMCLFSRKLATMEAWTCVLLLSRRDFHVRKGACEIATFVCKYFVEKSKGFKNMFHTDYAVYLSSFAHFLKSYFEIIEFDEFLNVNHNKNIERSVAGPRLRNPSVSHNIKSYSNTTPLTLKAALCLSFRFWVTPSLSTFKFQADYTWSQSPHGCNMVGFAICDLYRAVSSLFLQTAVKRNGVLEPPPLPSIDGDKFASSPVYMAHRATVECFYYVATGQYEKAVGHFCVLDREIEGHLPQYALEYSQPQLLWCVSYALLHTLTSAFVPLKEEDSQPYSKPAGMGWDFVHFTQYHFLRLMQLCDGINTNVHTLYYSIAAMCALRNNEKLSFLELNDVALNFTSTSHLCLLRPLLLHASARVYKSILRSSNSSSSSMSQYLSPLLSSLVPQQYTNRFQETLRRALRLYCDSGSILLLQLYFGDTELKDDICPLTTTPVVRGEILYDNKGKEPTMKVKLAFKRRSDARGRLDVNRIMSRRSSSRNQIDNVVELHPLVDDSSAKKLACFPVFQSRRSVQDVLRLTIAQVLRDMDASHCLIYAVQDSDYGYSRENLVLELNGANVVLLGSGSCGESDRLPHIFASTGERLGYSSRRSNQTEERIEHERKYYRCEDTQDEFYGCEKESYIHNLDVVKRAVERVSTSDGPVALVHSSPLHGDILMESNGVLYVSGGVQKEVSGHGMDPSTKHMFGHRALSYMCLKQHVEDTTFILFVQSNVCYSAFTASFELINSKLLLLSQLGTYLHARKVELELQSQVSALKIERDESDRIRRQAVAASNSKSTFLANVSHEIRTPLNGIIGMTDYLLDCHLDGDKAEIVQIMKNSGEALLAIINDTLDMSKIEANKLELDDSEFDLFKLVDQCMDVLGGPAAKKNVSLEYLIAPTVPRFLNGDVTRIRQILVNLLSNAVKFCRKGYVIASVTCRVVPSEEPELLSQGRPIPPPDDIQNSSSEVVLHALRTLIGWTEEYKGTVHREMPLIKITSLAASPVPQIKEVLSDSSDSDVSDHSIRRSKRNSVGSRNTLDADGNDTWYDLHFCVEDSGIGIPYSRVSRLFEMFSQVSADSTKYFGGTGLGLAISKHLCHRMGGRMWVESEEGKGSQFHFTLRLRTTRVSPPFYEIPPEPILLSLSNRLHNRRLLLSRRSSSSTSLPLSFSDASPCPSPDTPKRTNNEGDILVATIPPPENGNGNGNDAAKLFCMTMSESPQAVCMNLLSGVSPQYPSSPLTTPCKTPCSGTCSLNDSLMTNFLHVLVIEPVDAVGCLLQELLTFFQVHPVRVATVSEGIRHLLQDPVASKRGVDMILADESLCMTSIELTLTERDYYPNSQNPDWKTMREEAIYKNLQLISELEHSELMKQMDGKADTSETVDEDLYVGEHGVPEEKRVSLGNGKEDPSNHQLVQENGSVLHSYSPVGSSSSSYLSDSSNRSSAASEGSATRWNNDTHNEATTSFKTMLLDMLYTVNNARCSGAGLTVLSKDRKKGKEISRHLRLVLQRHAASNTSVQYLPRPIKHSTLKSRLMKCHDLPGTLSGTFASPDSPLAGPRSLHNTPMKVQSHSATFNHMKWKGKTSPKIRTKAFSVQQLSPKKSPRGLLRPILHSPGKSRSSPSSPTSRARRRFQPAVQGHASSTSSPRSSSRALKSVRASRMKETQNALMDLASPAFSYTSHEEKHSDTMEVAGEDVGFEHLHLPLCISASKSESEDIMASLSAFDPHASDCSGDHHHSQGTRSHSDENIWRPTQIAISLRSRDERDPETDENKIIPLSETEEEEEENPYLRILIAEDNAINRKVMLRLLDRLNYDRSQVIVVENGAIARDTIHSMNQSDSADKTNLVQVVLMDVQMPVLDGIAATKAIRQDGSIVQPFIIAVTANVGQEDVSVCIDAGMNDFLSKPIRLDGLKNVLSVAYAHYGKPLSW